MIEKKRCGDCVWFVAEPKTVADPQSAVGIIQWSLREPTEDITKPTYGKCNAVYTNPDNNNFHRYDMGVYSNWRCSARDARNKPLFESKS